MNLLQLFRFSQTPVMTLGVFAASVVPAFAEVDPQVEKALSVNTRQKNVTIELVPATELEKCTKRLERRGEVDGLLIIGPNSQPLRWFGDANKDRAIDIWSYFNNGVEVYRDIDSDFNGKVDQSRWFGTAGIRWGTDKDENGSVDEWKTISAEEVTMEIVAAVRDNDANRFATVLLSDTEAKSLGLGQTKQEELSKRLAKAASDFATFARGQKSIGTNSKWSNFGADKPGIVPAGTEGSSSDIVAYENVVAIVESDAGNQQLAIGSLVQVAPNQWRATDLPKIIDDNTVLTSTSVFFNGSMEQIAKANAGGLSERSQTLLQDLENIEAKLRDPATSDKEQLNAQRADIIEAIYDESTNPQDKETWAKQFADTVGTATQNKEYAAGLERMKEFESKVASLSEVAHSYVSYRIIGTDYTVKLADATNSEFATIQSDYLKQLESFVEKFPTSADAAEAMVSLGLDAELHGDVEKATKWYKQTAESFKETTPGKKATGAIARLSLEGRVIKELTGKTVDGKNFDSKNSNKAPTIMHFWATWCTPCKEDMKQIRKLQSKFAKSGLNVVGINLDNDVEAARKFLANRDNDYPWTHLYEEGGFESRLPVSLGVFSLPITIVLDSNNKVLLSTSHYTPEIETLIEEATKAPAK